LSLDAAFTMCSNVIMQLLSYPAVATLSSISYLRPSISVWSYLTLVYRSSYLLANRSAMQSFCVWPSTVLCISPFPPLHFTPEIPASILDYSTSKPLLNNIRVNTCWHHAIQLFKLCFSASSVWTVQVQIGWSQWYGPVEFNSSSYGFNKPKQHATNTSFKQ